MGGDPDRAFDQGVLGEGLVSRTGKEPAPGGGGEGHRDLEFRVIAPARAFIGMGPVVVEDVFALTVAFRIERRHADDLTLGTGDEVLRLPAASRADGTGGFECVQEAVGRERVKRPPTIGNFRTGAGIPITGRNIVQRACGFDLDPCFCHAGSACGPALSGAADEVVKRPKAEGGRFRRLSRRRSSGHLPPLPGI